MSWREWWTDLSRVPIGGAIDALRNRREASVVMLSFVVSVTTFIAMQLLAHKRIEGFYVGIVSQLLWVWLIVVTGQWGLSLLTGAILMTYVQGIRNWKRGVAGD